MESRSQSRSVPETCCLAIPAMLNHREAAKGTIMDFRAQKLGPSFKYSFQSFVYRMRFSCVIKMDQRQKAFENLPYII